MISKLLTALTITLVIFTIALPENRHTGIVGEAVEPVRRESVAVQRIAFALRALAAQFDVAMIDSANNSVTYPLFNDLGPAETDDVDYDDSYIYNEASPDEDNDLETHTVTFVPAVPNSLMVALTFDDGPCENTEKILDILEYHGVLATFCVIGNRIRNSEATLMRTFEAGHEVVGHSWNHARFPLLSNDDIKEQIVSTNDEIYRVLGVTSRFHRPPFGSINDSVKYVSEYLDMAILTWSVDPRDWETDATAESIYEHIMDYVFDGSILLFHDVHDVTVSAIEKIVPSLLARGYRFMTVSELFNYSERPVEAGRVYRHR